MTLKGFIRSYGAAVRRMERDQQRRNREAAKLYKQQLKDEMISDAGKAVREYDDYVNLLKSIHKDCSEYVDWDQLANERPPKEPVLKNVHENTALSNLRDYNPGFFDKLFGQVKKKVKALEEEVTASKEQDKLDYSKQRDKYRKEVEEWKQIQEIAKGVLKGSESAYRDALLYFEPFNEIKELGSKVSINIESKYVVIDLFVQGNEVVPNFVLTQTSTGKLSRKSMPVSKFNELYQDYVCSCVLRLAREALAYLPIQFAIVNAKADLLNTTNGKIESQTIVSAAIPPETLEKLQFESLDPSDSMKNFKHNMKFSKTTGFSVTNNIDALSMLT